MNTDKLTPITVERLKAAGFEPVDADKLTRKYELRTQWQTVTLYHQYRGAESFTLAGIVRASDRYTTTYAEHLIQAADLFGADEITHKALSDGMLGTKW